VEGGVTNGEEVVVRAAMKPIPTLKRPMATMDLRTKSPDVAVIERGDVCAVPAAAVVGETMVAMVVADLLLDKFGGDSVDDVRAAMEAYGKRVAGPVEGGRGGRS
jgi:chorismate synthase